MWLESTACPRIHINELSLTVGIGCTEKERAAPQELRLSVVLELPGAPRGALTDNLDDTICYHKICDHLSELVQTRTYQLLEKLAYEAYNEIKRLVPEGVRVRITIHKVTPPIAHLTGGICYVFGDHIV